MAATLTQVVERVAAEIVELFAREEARLIEALALEVKAGLSPDTAVQVRLTELRREAEQTVRRLQQDVPEAVQALVATAVARGTTEALRQLSVLHAPTREVPAAPAAALLASELTTSLTDATRRILRLPDDLYRTVIADTTATTLLTGQTLSAAQQRAWQRLLTKGVTGFVDSAGRQWDLASYVEMASRTAVTRAYREQHTQTMLTNDISLVTIVVGNDACEQCGQWAGKVLSLDGTTGTITATSAINGRPVRVKVHATLEEALDQGLEHPGCRCQRVGFFPGTTPIQDTPTHNPERERERDQLRAMERRVRELKRELLVTDNPTLVRAKIRAKQADIRDHVDRTGLNRKRYREQLHLSNQR